MSSATFRAKKSHFQVRTSVRNPIFRCSPLRCPPLGPPVKIILTTPHPPYLQKICPQNMPDNGGPYGIKSVKIKGFLQKIWHTYPQNMAYEPPPFMPYEPFLLGVGVVFNLLSLRMKVLTAVSHCSSHLCCNART